MDKQVAQKFATYPDNIRASLLCIREAIFAIATRDNIGQVSETLKWGEPSYLTAAGSTVRIDWKPKQPEHLCVYFHCQTTLVDTFKEIYGDKLLYEGNRAIVLPLAQEIPLETLQHCISMALRYHKIKHLPLLGA